MKTEFNNTIRGWVNHENNAYPVVAIGTYDIVVEVECGSLRRFSTLRRIYKTKKQALKADS